MMRVERSVVLPARPGVVWRALTGAMSDWFGAAVVLDGLDRGARANFSWPDGTERSAILEEVVPERTLMFRWLPFERTPEGTLRREATRVVFELAEEDGGTRVTVVESGSPQFGFVGPPSLSGAAR